MSNQIDGAYQIFYSVPGPIYIGTQTSIEALTGVQEGAFAVGYTATPADGVFGFYDGSVWVWGSGGGGGSVESVTGDGVDNTDPLNPVISYPTPGDIGAEPALGYTPENVANKKTTMTGNEASNTFYLTAKAIYDWATGLFLQKNSPITGATNTKITYDANGLVTAGTTLAASDIPSGIDATKIGAGSVDNIEFGYLNGATSAIQTQLDGKQASLGFTPENVANKKTTMTGNETSNTFYLTAKAVYDWAVATFNTRPSLSADRTYYVRTDGNDSNTGLTNTAGGAFLTIQHAIDVTASLDMGIYNVTIQIGNGTYAEQLTAKQCLGAGTVIIKGDETTPANVVISGATTLTTSGISTLYSIRGVKGTGSSGFFIISTNNARAEFQNVNIANTGSQQLRAADGGQITATGNYTISAGAINHWTTSGSGIIRVQARTITISGNPAFTYFADCSYTGVMFCNGCTFSGSATGARYTVAGNAVLYTGGGGASYLPGNSAGGTSTGGQYI